MNNRLKLALWILFVFLVIGTSFYHLYEGWSVVDSFYFTSITLTTIGYGDIAPKHDVSKLFTSVFAISGVAFSLYALTIIASDYFARREAMLVEGIKNDNAGEGSKPTLGSVLDAEKHILKILKDIDKQIKK